MPSVTLAWTVVAQEFEFDGSLRDVYVLDVELRHWHRVLDHHGWARW